MWSRLLLLAFLLLPVQALASAKEKVAALAPSGLVLVMDAEGKELVAQNADEPFVPASVAKIVTAWVAMQVLGGGLSLPDQLLPGPRPRALCARGRRSVPDFGRAGSARAGAGRRGRQGRRSPAWSSTRATIRLAFIIPGVEDSNRSYDAINSALAVNFNTINAVRSGNKVQSAEKQTPITPLAISEFRARGPNGRGRISLNQDPAVSVRYAGELIAAFIARAGGSVKGKISAGAVPAGHSRRKRAWTH